MSKSPVLVQSEGMRGANCILTSSGSMIIVVLEGQASGREGRLKLSMQRIKPRRGRTKVNKVNRVSLKLMSISGFLGLTPIYLYNNSKRTLQDRIFDWKERLAIRSIV
ncbi:unnamed protein product (mitochondrion) [Musa textilis]